MVDDGRTTEHGYTISSPCEPDGSGELKISDQWYYRGTLNFLVYRAGNVDTLVTNDISISQLGIEIFRSEK